MIEKSYKIIFNLKACEKQNLIWIQNFQQLISRFILAAFFKYLLASDFKKEIFILELVFCWRDNNSLNNMSVMLGYFHSLCFNSKRKCILCYLLFYQARTLIIDLVIFNQLNAYSNGSVYPFGNFLSEKEYRSFPGRRTLSISDYFSNSFKSLLSHPSMKK